MGEHDRAIAAGQRALALATTSGAFDVQVIAQTNLGVAYYAAGDFRQALDVARRVIAVLTGELRSARFGLPILPCRDLPWLCGLVSGRTGGLRRGSWHGRRSRAAGRGGRAALQYGRCAVCVLGCSTAARGSSRQAIPMLERGLALCQTADIPLLFPMTASLLSAAYALAGRAAEALPLLDQMLERVATGSRMLLHALVLTELSEALLLVGRVDEASALAGRLLELSRTHTGRGYQAHAYRLLGEVARRREPPDVDQAAAHYRQALALAEELGMRPLQAHCHLRPRHAVRQDRPAGAGPCRAVHRHRPVPRHGHDLLAAPGGGGAGAGGGAVMDCAALRTQALARCCNARAVSPTVS